MSSFFIKHPTIAIVISIVMKMCIRDRSSPARMAEKPSPAATTTEEGASRRRDVYKRQVSHNDDTPGWEFYYNHIGQMTYVRDASGLREFSYDAYGRTQQRCV